MADSSTYTPETIARRYAMAQQLLAEPKQPVRHWAEGLNELAKGALGGYQQNEAENLERRSRADANSQIAAALGLPAPAPVADNPSGFAKIAALFNPKSADAPTEAPQAPTQAPNPPIDIPGQQSLVSPQPVSGGNVPASIRFNNPGAQWPGPSADKFGSTGSGVISGNNKIAQFDSPVSGAAAQFDLLGRRYAGKTLGGAISEWSGKNNAPQYTAAVSQATGIPADAPITPEMLRDPKFAIPLAKAMAKHETGRDYPMSDEQWGQAHAMAFNGAPQTNPLANAPAVNGNGPSPLDTAQWPAGPVNAPGPVVDGNQPSPLDTAQYPAGPVGAPSAGDATTLSAQSAQPPSVAALSPQAAPQPIQSGPAPGILGGQPSAAPAATPPAGPTGAAPAGLAGNPNAAKIAALLTNPWIDPSVKTQVLTQLNPTYGFQTLPDGTILRTNPKTGTVEPIYSAPVKPELKETGSDPITGQKTFQVFDPKTQTMRPVAGPGGEQAQPQSGFLAPGVKSIDRTLSGDDYLNQFGPEVQAAVKSYIRGDVMPTGNARKDSIATQAKTIAQKYGQDMGIPVSDATYSQRRTYQSQLGSNSPSSAGGQAKAFNQGIEHMGHLADTLEKLDNSNGFGIPMVANTVNAVRQGVSTDQAAISDKASSIGQTLAGEVGKLFSGSAGGGVHERELTRERFSTVKSKPQLAAALEGTLEMMRGGLTALEQRRDEVMGQNSGIRFVNPETEAKIARIQETIDRLKGGTAAPQANAQPVATPEKTINGKTYYKFGPNPTDWAEK